MWANCKEIAFCKAQKYIRCDATEKSVLVEKIIRFDRFHGKCGNGNSTVVI